MTRERKLAVSVCVLAVLVCSLPSESGAFGLRRFFKRVEEKTKAKMKNEARCRKERLKTNTKCALEQKKEEMKEQTAGQSVVGQALTGADSKTLKESVAERLTARMDALTRTAASSALTGDSVEDNVKRLLEQRKMLLQEQLKAQGAGMSEAVKERYRARLRAMGLDPDEGGLDTSALGGEPGQMEGLDKEALEENLSDGIADRLARGIFGGRLMSSDETGEEEQTEQYDETAGAGAEAGEEGAPSEEGTGEYEEVDYSAYDEEDGGAADAETRGGSSPAGAQGKITLSTAGIKDLAKVEELTDDDILKIMQYKKEHGKITLRELPLVIGFKKYLAVKDRFED